MCAALAAAAPATTDRPSPDRVLIEAAKHRPLAASISAIWLVRMPDVDETRRSVETCEVHVVGDRVHASALVTHRRYLFAIDGSVSAAAIAEKRYGATLPAVAREYEVDSDWIVLQQANSWCRQRGATDVILEERRPPP